MTHFTIRRATLNDAFALSVTAQGAFLENFAGQVDGADILAHIAKKSSQAYFEDWLERREAALWLAEVEPGGAPIGYAGVIAPDDLDIPIAPGDIELRRIYVYHRFQGVGAAQALMSAAIEHAQITGALRMLIGVNAENARAIAFYTRNGFAQVGAREFQVGANRYHDAVLARSF